MTIIRFTNISTISLNFYLENFKILAIYSITAILTTVAIFLNYTALHLLAATIIFQVILHKKIFEKLASHCSGKAPNEKFDPFVKVNFIFQKKKNQNRKCNEHMSHA